jgi:S1-C subfamily serine protease
VRQVYEWRESDISETKKEERTGSRRRRFDLRKALSILLIICLSATAGFGGGLAASGFGTAAPILSGSGQSYTITPSDQISTTEAVAAKVIPSVVGITSKATRQFDTYFFGTYDQEVGGVGTGIIVDENGYILTNSHVVMDGDVDNIVVLLPDSREVEGRVLWQDKGLDLAIVKIETTNLVAANLGDSDAVRIGSYAAAIGNPLGLDFRGSVSQGVVSGLDRSITVGDSNSMNNIQMEGLLQVDAAINQGNSGGPLLNQKGEVIGINTAKTEGADGMGFAIPINVAKPIVESVKATGEFHRVYIGIQPRNVTDLLQAYPHLDLGVDKGAIVVSVTPGSPAEKGGLKENDIITNLEGKEIKSSGDLIKQLLGYKSGDMVTLTIMRDKTSLTVELALTDSLE